MVLPQRTLRPKVSIARSAVMHHTSYRLYSNVLGSRECGTGIKCGNESEKSKPGVGTKDAATKRPSSLIIIRAQDRYERNVWNGEGRERGTIDVIRSVMQQMSVYTRVVRERAKRDSACNAWFIASSNNSEKA